VPRPAAAAARRLLTHPRVEPAVSVLLLARLVRESPRFAWHELRRDRTRRTYRLRAGGAVHLEHGTPDVQVLDELWYQRLYEPPEPVAGWLAARAGRLRAVDLGANIGTFGAWLAARFGFADLQAFEPDARNLELLREAVRANGLEGTWHVHAAAAGARDGTVRFAGGAFATSHVADDGDVEVPVVDVLPLLAGADLLKLDAEGGEWPLLADARLAAAGPPVVVLEWHPEGAPGPDPHAEARRLLGAAGYAVRPIFEREDGVGMAWAWRPAVGPGPAPPVRPVS